MPPDALEIISEKLSSRLAVKRGWASSKAIPKLIIAAMTLSLDRYGKEIAVNAPKPTNPVKCRMLSDREKYSGVGILLKQAQIIIAKVMSKRMRVEMTR